MFAAFLGTGLVAANLSSPAEAATTKSAKAKSSASKAAAPKTEEKKASPSADNPSLLGAFRDWYAYSSGTGANQVCYVLSQPANTQPKGVNRDPIFFLISSWPKSKTIHQPNVMPGYTYKADSKPRAAIGSDKFDFFPGRNDKANGAWLDGDPSDEARFINAMKRGQRMIVTGVSARGTLTTDTYSLAGISAALDKIDTSCK